MKAKLHPTNPQRDSPSADGQPFPIKLPITDFAAHGSSLLSDSISLVTDFVLSLNLRVPHSLRRLQRVRDLTLPFSPFHLWFLFFLSIPLQLRGGQGSEHGQASRHSGREYSPAEFFAKGQWSRFRKNWTSVQSNFVQRMCYRLPWQDSDNSDFTPIRSQAATDPLPTPRAKICRVQVRLFDRLNSNF